MLKFKMRRAVALLAATIILTSSLGFVAAEEPYDGYNFDYWEDVVNTPIPYEPVMSISGDNLDTTPFSSPSDLAMDSHGNIYICDSGNDRIVVMDGKHRAVKIIDSFKNDGSEDRFNNPQGVFVSDEDDLYVADCGNNRVLRISKDGDMVMMFSNIIDEALPNNFVFEPLKVNVDQAGRVYVIAKNVFEGIMTFMPDGSYSGYFGTIKVAVTPWAQFWRLIATKEQRKKMKLYVPTEFTNMDVDHAGFVYTTNVDDTAHNAATIKRFNPSSKNVIRNLSIANNKSLSPINQKSELIGDLKYPSRGAYEGKSNLVDIDYRDKGIYSVLDSKRGRVITYDDEGNILYVFGGIGNQLGMLKQPTAIECSGDNIYLLDTARGEVVLYKATEYGRLINQAIGLRYDGDEGAAVNCWNEVLRMDASCRLANIGIGKSLLAENKNEEAMVYLKKGNDKVNYSVAFKRYRTDTLKEWFPTIVGALCLVVVAAFTVKIIKKRRRGKVG